MARELILGTVLLNILIFICQAEDLCREHPLSKSSALCQEYLKLTKKGGLKNCERRESAISCQNRCNNTNERNKALICYCDAKCSSLGDCCVDYSLWCSNSPRHSPRVTCCATSTDTLKGYMVQIGCPVSWNDEVTSNLCLGINTSEPLTRIPVYDYETNVTFNNVYCALCNNVSNFRYWQVRFTFQNSSDLEMAKNMSSTRLLNMYKDWSTEPAPSDLKGYCIPGVREIPATAFNRLGYSKRLWSFCEAYSMKVTGEDKMQYKNPHCGLLISNDTSIFYCPTPSVFEDPSPSSTYALLFIFKPKGTKVLHGSRDRRVQEYSCQPGKVYNPFENCCRKVIIDSTTIRLPNRSGIMLNNTWCTRVSYNSSEYFLYPNGSLLILSHQKIYTNRSYTRKGENILLCTNFTTNYTRSVYNKVVRLQTNSVANILGRVGSAISITALLCLLLTRPLFRELRTLHGKNVMNLSFSLVIFHIAFLISIQTEFFVCDVISGVRHYALLAMFAWMSVIACDVSRTFTAAGFASGGRDNDEEQRRFRIYSLYAWGMPLVVVIACVIMDVTKVADTGYGSGDQPEYCFLSPTGRIYCSAIPIGAVLLFNFVALIRTMIAIRRVQKGTRGVPANNPHPSMTVLCLKLTSVMGLTWVMGFVYAIENNPYVEYVHIVLNSLQGFFLFICFGCNKQILSLFKNKFCRRNIAGQPGQNNKTL